MCPSFLSKFKPAEREFKMFKRIAVIFAIFALLTIVGCGKAPEEEIQKANSAMEAARTTEAEDYAPDLYQMAIDTLNAAKAAKQEADGKFALFRSYGKAEELYVRAEALANQAATEAQSEKERVRAEVTGLLAQAKALLDSANVALSKAPRGKGTKADIELIKNDLAAATSAYDEAKADFDVGKYAVAKTKLEAAMQKARSISEEIAKAAAKKSK
ncbi:hypothetical protein AMJ44_10600 [candidate division WOR-1 bacterium DG_54_3]|uniref:DUF4398 domain-containing protein n=1 Tax=candidate division WOR-1 bacterium DG_54_3 TaxID=1703775 RepID=A0A0S7XSD4_UNCSA|nr:MAG: hypothetical protein AMJ44_10600 [candidate division WOR-1 bacterium DG_54_3]